MFGLISRDTESLAKLAVLCGRPDMIHETYTKRKRLCLFESRILLPNLMPGRTIVVLGATPKEDRYANMAMKLLSEHGEVPIPVNPAFAEVLGQVCYPNLAAVPDPIHTVTLYVGEARSTPLIAEILAANPKRIIFNPGAENEELAKLAEEKGIETVEGCTLVMLKTGAF